MVAGEQHGQSVFVLAAQVAAGRADPKRSVPGGGVSDQVDQRLWDLGGRVFFQEAQDGGAVAAGVEGAADGGGGEAVSGGRALAFRVGQQGQLSGKCGLQIAGRDGGEVGLEEYVVERFGQ